MKSSIILKNLIRQLHVGCTKQEQDASQAIIFHFELAMNQHPKACQSDNIEETIDVRTILQCIDRVCARPPFFTLECMAKTIEEEMAFMIEERKISFNIATKCSLTIEKPQYHWQYTHKWNQIF